MWSILHGGSIWEKNHLRTYYQSKEWYSDSAEVQSRMHIRALYRSKEYIWSIHRDGSIWNIHFHRLFKRASASSLWKSRLEDSVKAFSFFFPRSALFDMSSSLAFRAVMVEPKDRQTFMYVWNVISFESVTTGLFTCFCSYFRCGNTF